MLYQLSHTSIGVRFSRVLAGVNRFDRRFAGLSIRLLRRPHDAGAQYFGAERLGAR